MYKMYHVLERANNLWARGETLSASVCCAVLTDSVEPLERRGHTNRTDYRLAARLQAFSQSSDVLRVPCLNSAARTERVNACGAPV